MDRLRAVREVLAGAALISALTLSAGCAGGQTYPPLSPIAEAKSYGYSEEAAGQNRFNVSYQGRSKRVANYSIDGQRESDTARVEALDFALWRAAQIARTAGFAGFRVIDQRADVDVSTQPIFNDRDFYAPFGPSVGSTGIPRGNTPGMGSEGARAGRPESSSAQIQARAAIAIELVRQPGPGDYNPAEVIGRMKAVYPDAERAPAN